MATRNVPDPYARIRRTHNRGGPDIHEMQKEEIYRQGHEQDPNYRFGLAPIVSNLASPPTSEEVGFEEIKLYLDSYHKDGTSDLANGELKFKVSELNNGNDLINIIRVAFPEFYFPRVDNGASEPNFYFFRRVFITLDVLNQQGVKSKSERFAIECAVEDYTAIAVRLVPLGDTSFFLTNPISTTSEILLKFSVPGFPSMRRIPLPQDRLSVVSVAGTNPAEFDIITTDTTAVIAPVGAIAAPGVAVFINGFNSPNAAVNAQVNSQNGVFVTTILSATRFQVASLNLAGIAAFPATVEVGKNRIAFVLSTTSLRNRKTNHIYVGHE